MSRIEFSMFRLKLVRAAQASLFGQDLSRRDLIKKILDERPSILFQNGHHWHIGNLSFLDGNGGYFAVGRTTRSKLETFDAETGNFIEEQLETSPYTHVLFDRAIGFVAVAKKSKLAAKVEGIARRIGDLFQESEAVDRNQVEVRVDAISDPYDFVESLKSAHSIQSFEATFGRPNPFDADELFLKCSEGLLDAADAEKGKTRLAGKSLNARTLVTITGSVAATGNQATARLRFEEGGNLVKKHLRGNPARFEVEEEDFEMTEALARAREEYRKVRGADDATV